MFKHVFAFCITLCVNIMPAYTQSYKYLRAISEAGLGDRQLSNPLEMVILNDTIYIIDGTKIKKFDTTGIYLGQWGVFNDLGNNIYMGTINTNSEGRILLFGENEFQECTTQGKLVKRIKITDVFGSNSSFITAIKYDKIGNIYASDRYKNRVYKLTASGSIVKYWQYSTDTTYNSDRIARIYIDDKDRIYLRDFGWPTIQKFDTNGKLLDSWIDTAQYRTNILAFGKNGTMFVPRTNSIELLDSNFQFITTVARTGINEGQYYGANGMAIDSKGNFYVVNRALETNILVFAYSENPTGIEDENRNGLMSRIYPNPFQDVLEVNVQGQGEATLELTDLTGRIVSSTPFNFNPAQLNTSQLQKGLYLCRIIQNGKQMFVAKVQK